MILGDIIFHVYKRNVCNKLYIDGKTYTDTENLLECWRDHFCSIGTSKLSGVNPSDVIGSKISSINHPL